MDPVIFFIFGITGDLSRTKLIPALFELWRNNQIDRQSIIWGWGRREWKDRDLKDFVRGVLSDKYGRVDTRDFVDRFFYVKGNFDDLASYESAEERLRDFAHPSAGYNKIFYLSAPPEHYSDIVTNLKNSRLANSTGPRKNWSRILIEKPFGTDLQSSKKLNTLLKKLFKEDQIYRVDHYLTKESVMRLFSFRQSNQLLKAIWNRDHIKKISIRLFEEKTIGTRGPFYDASGAIRDVFQNHLLELLSIVLMDFPKNNKSETNQKERAKVLNKLKLIKGTEIAKRVLIGQYDGYKTESGVKDGSSTETYFKIKVESGQEQLKGVPIYLESGKALVKSEVYIEVHFKEGNVLRFDIQPKSNIEISLLMPEEKKAILFSPETNIRIPESYETLFLKVIESDKSMFPSPDEIFASWKFTDAIIKNIHKLKLLSYPEGGDPDFFPRTI